MYVAAMVLIVAVVDQGLALVREILANTINITEAESVTDKIVTTTRVRLLKLAAAGGDELIVRCLEVRKRGGMMKS